MITDRQTASQPASQPARTDRQTASQPASQTDRQPASQPGRQTASQPASQAGRQTDRQPARQAGRQTGRQTDRQTKKRTNERTNERTNKQTKKHAKQSMIDEGDAENLLSQWAPPFSYHFAVGDNHHNKAAILRPYDWCSCITDVFKASFKTELFSTMPGSRKPLCSRTGRKGCSELLAFYSLQTYRSHLTKKYVEQWLVQNWIGPRRCSWRCQLLWIIHKITKSKNYTVYCMYKYVFILLWCTLCFCFRIRGVKNPRALPKIENFLQDIFSHSSLVVRHHPTYGLPNPNKAETGGGSNFQQPQLRTRRQQSSVQKSKGDFPTTTGTSKASLRKVATFWPILESPLFHTDLMPQDTAVFTALCSSEALLAAASKIEPALRKADPHHRASWKFPHNLSRRGNLESFERYQYPTYVFSARGMSHSCGWSVYVIWPSEMDKKRSHLGMPQN